MSDQWIPVSHEDPASISETVAPRKLPTQWGGTGKSASSTGDLLTQLGVVNATGSASGAAGTAGFVPAPSAGTQYQALRGDMTHSTSLQVSSIVDSANTEVVAINAFGDLGCKPFLAAADAAGQRSRVGSTGSTVSSIDYQIEPKSYGRVTRLGDPIPQTMKPTRRVQVIPITATFATVGLPSPSISSPGAAAASLTDNDGCYVSMTYDGTALTAATFEVPTVARRIWDPELLVVFRSSFITARFWCGLFTGSPANSNTLGAVKGCGFRFTASTDGGQFQVVTSDGTSQTTTASGISAVANTITALRLRHIGGGNWDFAIYNYSTSSWQWTASQATGPAASDNLSVWVTLDPAGTTQPNRSMSIKVIDLLQE
jgi:hypothetical protein